MTAVSDDDWLGGFTGLRSDCFNCLHNVHTFNDGTEDAMLTVQPFGLDGTQEELGTVGVWPCVGHGQDTWSGVLELEVLVFELVSVDGFPTGSVTCGEITSLTHKLWDHTMEGGALEVQWLSGPTHTLFTRAESTKVFDGSWDDIGSKFHNNTSGGLTTNGHIEEDFWVGHFEDLFLSNRKLVTFVVVVP